ncbi:MAG: hypothetical protein ISR55_01250 [Bacteroidetes bacterium]|nr:hypothetical protein [Bacteroidota bacterium]
MKYFRNRHMLLKSWWGQQLWQKYVKLSWARKSLFYIPLLILVFILISWISKNNTSFQNSPEEQKSCDCFSNNETKIQLKELPVFEINPNFTICLKSYFSVNGITLEPYGQFYVIDCINNKVIAESLTGYKYELSSHNRILTISIMHSVPYYKYTEFYDSRKRSLIEFNIEMINESPTISSHISYSFPSYNSKEIQKAIFMYNTWVDSFNLNPSNNSYFNLQFNSLNIFWCVLNGSEEARILLNQHESLFVREKISKIWDYDKYLKNNKDIFSKNINEMIQCVKMIDNIKGIQDELFKSIKTIYRSK